MRAPYLRDLSLLSSSLSGTIPQPGFDFALEQKGYPDVF